MEWRGLEVDGVIVAPVEMAVTARARSRGLLGRSGLSGALWLAPARQVHTFKMAFAIDVAYVDSAGTVIHAATMAPGKLGKWCWRSSGVVEAEAGAFARWQLKAGSRVQITAADTSTRS